MEAKKVSQQSITRMDQSESSRETMLLGVQSHLMHWCNPAHVIHEVCVCSFLLKMIERVTTSKSLNITQRILEKKDTYDKEKDIL